MRLVLPSAKYRASFLRAIKEFNVTGYGIMWPDVRIAQADFTEYLQRVRDLKLGKNLRPGWVPQTDYWLVEGLKFIGRISIRHRLNKNLRLEGGHIGYEIRPSERRKGYGARILRLGLRRAAKLGITNAVLTCDYSNQASRKIIEANGGRLQKRFNLHGKDKLKFIVPTV